MEQSKDNKRANNVRDMIIIIILALAIAFAVKNFVLDSMVVPTASMYPTVHIGDRILMNRLSYIGDNPPQRGDIVVFKAPADADVNGDLLKRIIGEPGDLIEVKNSHVYINGDPYEEGYLAETIDYEYGPVTVPEGQYFMLGDNRNLSADSHYWQDPFIPAEDIKGKAFLCYWPLDRIALISIIH